MARGQEAGRGSDPALARAIDAALNVPALAMGFQGVLIQSLTDGSTLYERNADPVFLPASNNKLLTSAATLAILGPNYVYRTRLFRTGPITRVGTLQGELVLRGAGDPLLSPRDLDEIARQVARAGIRRVTGGVRFDDSLFDRQRLGEGWSWDDEPYYYSAQISALNLNENLVSVQVLPGRRVGEHARVLIGPTDKYTALVNTALTGPPKSKPSLVIGRVRGRNILTVSGSLPIDVAAKDNRSVGVTIENPSRFAAFVLAERLRRQGVAIAGGVREGAPISPEAPVVAEHVSVPLSALLRRLNKPSDNLIAECLLKTVGAACRGQGTGGADGTGAQAARDWLARIGLDVSRLRMADGSGLSRRNYVSPRNLVRLLVYLHTLPTFPIFYNSLPIAGADGTLRRRLRGTAAAGNCHAKTGSLAHVSSLSGYVTTRDGEMLAFSILMNNHLAPNRDCAAVQDKIVALLASYSRKSALHSNRMNRISQDLQD